MSPSETMHQTDHYTVLGADPMAQLDQIEALFRELAIEAETTGDHSKVPQAVEAFKVLRDPQLRHQYDTFLNQQRAQVNQQQQVAALQTQQFQAQAQAQAQATASQSELAQAMQRVSQPEASPAQATQELQTPVEHAIVSQTPMISAAEKPAVETVAEPVVEAIAEPVVEAIAEPVVEEVAEPVVAISPEQTDDTPTEGGQAEQATPEHAPDNKSTLAEELLFMPDVLDRHRRELLRTFYEKRRADMRAAGIAIGGLDTVVSYSYELLEFHLWVLAEKKWVVREESGALAITASGCENHEQNLTNGLIKSTLG